MKYELSKGNKIQITKLINLVLNIFDTINTFSNGINLLIKYCRIPKLSFLNSFICNKNLLKIWTASISLEIVKSLDQLKKIKRGITLIDIKMKSDALKYGTNSTDLEYLKLLKKSERGLKALNYKYKQVLFDIFQSTLQLVSNIMKLWNVKQKIIKRLDRFLQMIEITRIGYEIITFDPKNIIMASLENSNKRVDKKKTIPSNKENHISNTLSE